MVTKKSFFGVLRTHGCHVNLSKLLNQDAQNLGVECPPREYTPEVAIKVPQSSDRDRVSKSDPRLEAYGNGGRTQLLRWGGRRVFADVADFDGGDGGDKKRP